MKHSLRILIVTLTIAISNLIQITGQSTPDSIQRDSMNLLKEEISKLREQELALRLEMTQKEIKASTNDSIRKQNLKQTIDSIKKQYPPIPVIIKNDTLLLFQVPLGGASPERRAISTNSALKEIIGDIDFSQDSLILTHDQFTSAITYKGIPVLSISDLDAQLINEDRLKLAENYLSKIKLAAGVLSEDHGFWANVKRIGLFILVIVGQFLLIKLVAWIFRRIRKRIFSLRHSKLHSIIVKDYELLDVPRQLRMLLLFNRIAQLIVNIIQLSLTLPILFSIFPQTKHIADRIFDYILTPITGYWYSFWGYTPKLITIIITYFLIRYVVKGVEYFCKEIENGKLRITGFYPDWAIPTFKIIRFILYAFMITIIYPLLPGSQTEVFKGVSVFVGLMVSLGSTSLIGNVGAGLLITYMRPFKIGDRIKLNDTVGNVIEKTLFVTRVRTPKNEIITIPNSFILSAQTINYTTSAQTLGLVISSSVTIGYDAPWTTVHKLLIEAARKTEGVIIEPAPFVLQTELSDFYVCYQINAYISDANQMAFISSRLHANIQNEFNNAGVEIMSPHYRSVRDGNESTIPKV